MNEFPKNEPTSTGTNKKFWTRAQNSAVVREYFALSADKRNGALVRGAQAERMRILSDTLSRCGPARGKPDMKFQNISAILENLGRSDLICAGFRPLPNTQTDRRHPDFDAALWATIQSHIAESDARAAAIGVK